jgi:hypothetical protein
MGRFDRAVAASAFLLLAGCAAPEIPFDRTAAGEVRTIGVVTPALPDGPSVVLASSVGRSFGLVGALVDAGMQSSRESTFKGLIAQQDFSATNVFIARLKDGLQKQGYALVDVPLQRSGRDFASGYPKDTDPKPDALLDLVLMDYGYVAAGISSSAPYRPYYALRARLVGAKDSAVLMQDAIVYNPINTPPKTITIAPDPTPQYKDFDALAADPKGAVDGLRIGAEKTADAVVGLLK